MPPAPESWLSKLRWRLDHGLDGPALRAITELSPATDPEVIRALIGALSYRAQDVREGAARVLGLSGWRYAKGPQWSEAATALSVAAKRAFDEEERANMERAAARIEARLENPPPGEDESL